MAKDEQTRKIEQSIKAIEAKFGKGSIFQLGDDDNVLGVEAISTGSRRIDDILGVGGIPRGRITEIYGWEQSGKSTLALSTIKQAQLQGGIGAFIDAEHALDRDLITNLGLDHERLLISQPDDGEQALEIVDQLCRDGGVDVVVVDSISALTPRTEIEGEMSDQHVGLQARLMSQAMRKLTHSTKVSNTALIFLNQFREKIVAFSDPRVTSGGNAIKFYASVRMEVSRRGKPITNKDDIPYAGTMKTKVVKSKVSPPYKETETRILFGIGIDEDYEILQEALERDIIQKKGAGYHSFKGENVAQGADNALEWVKKNREMLKKELSYE